MICDNGYVWDINSFKCNKLVLPDPLPEPTPDPTPDPTPNPTANN